MANTSEAQAQDLIARQAPIDRKMKAVDSVVINKAIVRQQPVVEVNYEQTELYTTWDTKTVHCYGKQQTPDRYTIDLRGFAMPTPSKVVTSNFGYRASFGRMHKGLDVKVYIGDTIVSAFDGKVRIVNYEAKGYGNYVVIRHNNGLETIYGHLSKHLCKTGDVVKAGQPIGLGGNTGRSTGSHLHFETRILGEAINPALLFDFVHQDVTCDFYEYRRNGGGGAVASKPKSNPAPVAKAAPAKPAAPAPAKAPAKSSAPAPAKSTAPAPAKSSAPAPAKTTAPAKAPAKTTAPATPKTKAAANSATAKADAPAPAKAKTKAAAPAQGGKATAKADAPAPAKAKTKAAAPAQGGKATAKADAPAPAKAKTKAAAPAQGSKTKAATTAAPKTKAAAPAQGTKTKAAAPATKPAAKGAKATATAGKAQGKPKA